jgi:sugar lactone lactonase YvrE
VSAAPERVLRARARLGEGPAWDAASRSLVWVDIYDRRVHRFCPRDGSDQAWDVPTTVGFAVPAADGRIVVGLEDRVALLDPATGGLETVAEVEVPEGGRINDGKCDGKGRLWLGTMAKEEGRAALWRLEADGRPRRMETGLAISNGLGWSPDGRTFYLTDSPRQVIHAYDFDAEAGEIGARRVFVDVTGEEGFPDGLAVDAQGCVWSARFAGGCVVRYDPGGREVERIAFPVPRPTSCAFGGDGLRDLYVTSAQVGMQEDEIDAAFDSGDLFRVRCAVAGVPVAPWAGAG